MVKSLQKALQIAIFSKSAINGTTIIPEPSDDIISKKLSPCWIISLVVSFTICGIENGGGWNGGNPDGTGPIILSKSS